MGDGPGGTDGTGGRGTFFVWIFGSCIFAFLKMGRGGAGGTEGRTKGEGTSFRDTVLELVNELNSIIQLKL